MVERWIPEDNLYPFLCTAFDFIGYEFDESDWHAVEYGIKGTDAEQDKWFDYQMKTEASLFVAVAHDDNSSVIFVKAESTPEIEVKIAVVLDLMQHYHLS